MKQRKHLLIILSLAIAALSLSILAGCSMSSGYSFDGGKVEVSGKKLTVTLETNPSTGYDWLFDIEGNGILNTEETTETTTSTGLVTGSSSKQIYVFEGKKADTNTITLKYTRSWESTDADKTIVIEVVTGSNGKISKTTTSVDGKQVGGSSI